MAVSPHKIHPLHPRERLFLGLAIAELIWLPWALGCSRVPGQIPAFVLSVLLMLVTLLPRRYEAEGEQGAFKLQSWPRLLKFPPFWLGLALLAYIGLGIANPSWRRESNAQFWWMLPVDNMAWLPTSAVTPFDVLNAWRVLMLYGAAWLTACALWIGVTRRRTLQILLTVLVASTMFNVLLGIIRHVQGIKTILWLLDVPGAQGFGSFIYHNHGAAYVALLTFGCLALAGWYHGQGLRRMARSSPAMAWLIGSFFLLLGVAYSTSRAGIGLLVVFMGLASVVYFLVRRLDQSHADTTPAAVKVALALIFGGCFVFILSESDLSELTDRLLSLQKQGASEYSFHSRVLVRERAIHMLSDHWVRGTGAGSFGFLFPVYTKDSKELQDYHVWWDHAHIDWLEIPIELGITGVLLIAGAFGWCVWKWFKLSGWRHPVGLMLALGLLQTMAHAAIDFPFQNMAILVTWWALMVIMLRWLELDEKPTATEKFFPSKTAKLR